MQYLELVRCYGVDKNIILLNDFLRYCHERDLLLCLACQALSFESDFFTLQLPSTIQLCLLGDALLIIEGPSFVTVE